MKPNLEIDYLGLRLAHPIVASAGPLTGTVEGFRRLEAGGASAIVMHSLFEEQIIEEARATDHFLEYGTESYGEALSYIHEPVNLSIGPEGYLSLLAKARAEVRVPIIGSLNGVTPGGWSDYAEEIEKAGADALELNLYNLPTDPEISGAEIEEQYLYVVKEVRAKVSIPLAVKLSPFLSAPAHMIRQLVDAGVDGVVLFNRFYQPDFDLDELKVVPNLVLSSSQEMRLPLRWVAILHGMVEADFAITSGVHCTTDVLKGLMAGARAVMTTSEVLLHGPERIGEMVQELETWMEEREYESVVQMLGSMSRCRVEDPSVFERANYRKTLLSWRPDPVLGH